MINIPDYFADQLSFNRGPFLPYTQDYVGAVQMLEKAGFSPFTDTNPLKSTLNQIFDRFVQKTGLENTFAAR